MIELSGSIKTFPRGYLADGVSFDKDLYDLSNGELKRGRRQIKGVLGAVLDDDMFIPYGRSGFFYSLPGDDIPKLGVKIYYSLDKLSSRSQGQSKKTWKKYVSCHEAGISPKPVSVTDVNLDLTVNNCKVNTACFGIIIEKVCYPEDALKQFAGGEFYDFECLDKEHHKDHNPQDFKKFRRHATKVVSQLKMSSCGVKLGDIVYCTSQKRWYMVDCG